MASCNKQTIAKHHGYHAGHPWYYLLGGDVPTPKQIQAAAAASDYCGYMAEELSKIDRQCEPNARNPFASGKLNSNKT